MTENAKWLYAFGGVGDDDQQSVLSSIERVKISMPNSPDKDVNAKWTVINLQMHQPLLNVGCVQLSVREVLIFGGFNAYGDVQTSGKVLMIDNDEKSSHIFLESTIDLQNADLFTNSNYY